MTSKAYFFHALFIVASVVAFIGGIISSLFYYGVFKL